MIPGPTFLSRKSPPDFPERRPEPPEALGSNLGTTLADAPVGMLESVWYCLVLRPSSSPCPLDMTVVEAPLTWAPLQTGQSSKMSYNAVERAHPPACVSVPGSKESTLCTLRRASGPARACGALTLCLAFCEMDSVHARDPTPCLSRGSGGASIEGPGPDDFMAIWLALLHPDPLSRVYPASLAPAPP
ncbi:unnamed protein product [Pleuronectes platessa]|uniref:Uncharacterized protein n=1 Tax=Pleuronectes platessa TaxID=8262 RepID=A0A9N7Z1B5_PLEPL|nr:unnamed protein product [Pleuronectes platessa]